jgi:hypothetical protein
MEPPPRPPSNVDLRRGITSPQSSQSSQSEQGQDISRRSSATDQQQSRQAPIYELSSPADPISEELLEEQSIGELTTPQSTLTSLHDITSFAMSRHQSGSRHQTDRNPSIQLLSPESSQNPRRMSQVSPGFIFVNFRRLCVVFLNACSFPSLPLFPMSNFLCLSYRQTHLLWWYLLTQLPE